MKNVMEVYTKYMIEFMKKCVIHVITIIFQEEFNENVSRHLRPYPGHPGGHRHEERHGDRVISHQVEPHMEGTILDFDDFRHDG